MTRRSRAQAPVDDDEADAMGNDEAQKPALSGCIGAIAPNARARRLRKVSDVTMELSTIYGMARRGRMSWADAAKAAFILKTAGDLLVTHDLEARLDRIEKKGHAA